MKKSLIVISLILALSGLLHTSAQAQSSGNIIDKVDSIMAPELFTAKGVMEVEQDNKDKKYYEMTIYRRAEKSLIAFTSPSVEKGRRVLRRGDDMWMYIPNVKRPSRISAKQDLMGGDFNNVDILRVNLGSDYTSELVETQDGVWILLLTAKNTSLAYHQIKAHIAVDTYYPILYEYYTLNGKLIKLLEFSEPKDFGDGVVRPSVMKMKSHLNDDPPSVLTFSSYTVNKSLPNRKFTLEEVSRMKRF